MHADEQTTYWKSSSADEVETLWMTRHNKTVGTAHAVSAKPSVLHSQFAYNSELGIWNAKFIEDTWLPMSSWWRADNKFEAAPTNTGYFHFRSDPQEILEIQVGSELTRCHPVAKLEIESRSYSFKTYKCEQSIRKLRFNDPALTALENELDALAQAEVEKAHAYWNMQYERDSESLINPRREIYIEQRLLHLQAERCTLLLISQTYSGGAHGSTKLLALNYFLTPVGSWQRYVPLTRYPEPEALKAQIRDALNQVDADGDYFYREENKPLDPSTRMFQVLQIGSTPWAIFEPYAVAAGAFGSFSVPINLGND